jgi:hypothetical protein
MDAAGGRYTKRLKPGTKDPLPENNWVWSPQGVVNMHVPERWGYVQFSGRPAGSGTDSFVEDPNERVKWALRRLYYRQRDFRAAHGGYADRLDALGPSARAGTGAGDIRVDGFQFRPAIQATPTRYEISAKGFGGAVVHLDQDGRVWLTR